jgi:hypothetical protein
LGAIFFFLFLCHRIVFFLFSAIASFFFVFKASQGKMEVVKDEHACLRCGLSIAKDGCRFHPGQKKEPEWSINAPSTANFWDCCHQPLDSLGCKTTPAHIKLKEFLAYWEGQNSTPLTICKRCEGGVLGTNACHYHPDRKKVFEAPKFHTEPARVI